MNAVVSVVQKPKKHLRSDYRIAGVPNLSNRTAKKLVSDMKRLKKQLESLRAKCQHVYIPLSYREPDAGFHGGVEVGKFDIFCACKKCGHKETFENSPPLCSCCMKLLQLKVWEGKGQNDATGRQIGVWKREYARRRVFPVLSGHSMFCTQFGLYVCTNEACKNHDRAKFFITGGD